MTSSIKSNSSPKLSPSHYRLWKNGFWINYRHYKRRYRLSCIQRLQKLTCRQHSDQTLMICQHDIAHQASQAHRHRTGPEAGMTAMISKFPSSGELHRESHHLGSRNEATLGMEKYAGSNTPLDGSTQGLDEALRSCQNTHQQQCFLLIHSLHK
jgi:hypothetical protein